MNAAVKSSRLIPLLSTLRPSIMGVPFSRNSSSEAKSAKFVDEKIHSNCVMIFSKSTCPFCTLAKRTFQDIGANYDVVELNHHDSGNDIMRELKRRTGSHTVPQVFINGSFIGGGSETKALKQSGELSKMVEGCCGQQAKL